MSHAGWLGHQCPRSGGLDSIIVAPSSHAWWGGHAHRIACSRPYRLGRTIKGERMNHHAKDWTGALAVLLESSQDRDPAEVIRDLCDLAHAMGDETAEALLDADPTLYRHVPPLTRAFYERVVRKEMAETERLLQQVWAGPVSFIDVASPAVMRTYNRVREMFERVDFRACRRFVMVGCGRLPVTMFHVHDQTETTEIVGLDIVPDAIETARKMAARFGYPRIGAELCDGQTHDYGQAQIIFITN